MIYHNEDEVVPGFTLDVILTDGWSNEAYRSGLSILRNYYPIREERQFSEIENSAAIFKRGDDTQSVRFSIIADYNTFEGSIRARCSVSIAKKVVDDMGILPPGMELEHVTQDVYKAIDKAYMDMIESVIIKSKGDAID